MTTRRHTPSSAGPLAADKTGRKHLACETCLHDIPADSVKVTDTQDYVHHFCGLDCLEKWQKQAQTRASAQPEEPSNRLK